MNQALPILVFTAAIGSGIIGGVFFAFSTFVMAALGRLPAAHGTAAMNAINVTVINPFFMTAFLGTALLCLLIAGGSLVWPDAINGKLILAASLVYLIGSFGVTMVCNVPLNEQLAQVRSGAETAMWARYLENWTYWNHVRTVASIASAVLFTAALWVI